MRECTCVVGHKLVGKEYILYSVYSFLFEQILVYKSTATTLYTTASLTLSRE